MKYRVELEPRKPQTEGAVNIQIDVLADSQEEAGLTVAGMLFLENGVISPKEWKIVREGPVVGIEWKPT